jgi:hypothetical protein
MRSATTPKGPPQGEGRAFSCSIMAQTGQKTKLTPNLNASWVSGVSDLNGQFMFDL